MDYKAKGFKQQNGSIKRSIKQQWVKLLSDTPEILASALQISPFNYSYCLLLYFGLATLFIFQLLDSVCSSTHSNIDNPCLVCACLYYWVYLHSKPLLYLLPFFSWHKKAVVINPYCVYMKMQMYPERLHGIICHSLYIVQQSPILL